MIHALKRLVSAKVKQTKDVFHLAQRFTSFYKFNHVTDSSDGSYDNACDKITEKVISSTELNYFTWLLFKQLIELQIDWTLLENCEWFVTWTLFENWHIGVEVEKFKCYRCGIWKCSTGSSTYSGFNPLWPNRWTCPGTSTLSNNDPVW